VSNQGSNFGLELGVIWDLLDSATEPAPSHRNRTITQWAEVMVRAKRRVLALRNQAAVVDDEIAVLQSQVNELTAQLRSIPLDAIAQLVIEGDNEEREIVNDWLRLVGYWKSLGLD
jgi:NAD-specific glutamate dehydrogenase